MPTAAQFPIILRLRYEDDTSKIMNEFSDNQLGNRVVIFPNRCHRFSISVFLKSG